MYSKLLIAKHNPENKCFANEGEVLTVIPKKPHPKKDGKYYFIGSHSKEKSQYGWVAEVEPFSLNDFVKKYAIDPTDQSEWDFIKTMLDSVKRHSQGTPMATSFDLRGAMKKQVAFTVHKVLFY